MTTEEKLERIQKLKRETIRSAHYITIKSNGLSCNFPDLKHTISSVNFDDLLDRIINYIVSKRIYISNNSKVYEYDNYISKSSYKRVKKYQIKSEKWQRRKLKRQE